MNKKEKDIRDLKIELAAATAALEAEYSKGHGGYSDRTDELLDIIDSIESDLKELENK